MPRPVRVAVTGAAGNICYSLLPRIAAGEVFGRDTPVILQLLEIPLDKAQAALRGISMELDDCAFPLLQDIILTDKPEVAFKDANWCLLVGSKPRGPGQERADLLKDNGKIFIGQGRSIDAVAAADCRVAVVGNPCNTNCMIAMNNARPVPTDRWFAMTMLDQNRAVTQLAIKAGTDTAAVSHLAIWGNHSSTMYPDYFNARIGGRPETEVIADEAWFKDTFIPTVQQRGAAVIKARGLSSAASAANAVVDTVRSLTTPTRDGAWFSVAVCSDGSYGIEKGLIYSYPVSSDGTTWRIVQGLQLGDFSKSRIVATENELKEEKSLVSGLIPK